MSRRYPLEPFFALTHWTMSDVQNIAGCGGKEWRRRRAEGVTELVADRIACAAGLAPLNIWPDFGMVPCAADDCAELFAPTDPRQRFCSHRCVGRLAARRRREDPAVRAQEARDRRRRYQEASEYERRREHARYWADPERARAAARRRRSAKKAA